MRAILAAALTLAFAGSASAQALCNKYHDSDPAPPVAGSLVTYLHIDDPSATDTRASYVTYLTDTIPPLIGIDWQVDLKGYLFVPSGTGSGRRAIVYSHGGTEPTMPPCSVVKWFVSRGYVFFAPLRRGEYPSTGAPIDTWVDTECPGCSAAEIDAKQVEYFRKQSGDLRSAAAYVQTLPSVNDNAVILMGHSNGAIVSLLANEATGQLQLIPLHRVVIDISAGGLSWNENVAKHDAILHAASHAMKPLFIMQGTMEPNYPDPTLTVGANTTVQHVAHYYPGTHNSVVSDPGSVALWAPDVRDFLNVVLP